MRHSTVLGAETGTRRSRRRKEPLQPALAFGIDLQEQRRASLQRVRQALDEMLIVLEQSPLGTPTHERVASCIKRLRDTERRLEAGIVPAND